MNVGFYPQNEHVLQHLVRPLCSEHGGITQSLLVSPLRFSEGLDLRSITAQMPPYHKVLLDPDLNLQYHLGGYGTFHEEALTRLAGEAVERYSLLVAPCTLGERIRYATYEEISRSGRVIPLEYLRLFSESDYVKLNRGRHRDMKAIEPGDVVGWLQCPSLFDPESDVWVPAQMLFVGYKHSAEAGEIGFTPAFSTGTAAHVTIEKALLNALLEIVEIDALMLRWYTEMAAPRVTVDRMNVASLLPRLLGAGSPYEVLALDLRVLEGVDAHVFGSILINKRGERPYITLGAQGHLDPLKGFYRGLMEALAISFLGIYGPLYLPREYLSTQGTGFTDLDSNVALFASPDDAEAKRAVVDKLISGKAVMSAMKSYDTGDAGRDAVRLIRQLSRYSEYGVYLDVTAPEARAKGWHVMRVLVPELVTMCVPGVPYTRHPRIEAHGGVRNEYPHPLP